ncbi:MAG: CaiB/BaiF CoA transferase family protein [Candidatus Binatia bacterium]
MSRILDLTEHSGAYAARLLAETGHDVIRIEPPEGDRLRRLGPYLGGKPGLETGSYHQFLNAGKRSLTLNLKSPACRKIFLDLVKSADAVLANLPLPVDEAVLLDARPNLVLVKIEDGEPELCAVARSGLLAITGHPRERPVLLGGHVVYAAIGLHVAVAAAAALYVLQQTGAGQVVSVSAQQCLQGLAEQAMVTYTSTGKVTERRGYRGAVTAVSGAFPCADGYWMVSVPHTPEGWVKFMDWVQDPVLMADTALLDEAERNAKKDLILDRLAEWSKKFKKAEIVTEAQRRHIPASPVSTAFDLAQDPQLVARGFLTEIDHPLFGKILFPVGAIASVLGRKLEPAPLLGQHSTEIFAELGYSAADHQALLETMAM